MQQRQRRRRHSVPAPRRDGASAAARVRALTRELEDIGGRLRYREREYEQERREAVELSRRAEALSGRLATVREKLRLAFSLMRSGPQRADIAALRTAAQRDERSFRRLADAFSTESAAAAPRPLTPLSDTDSDFDISALPGLGLHDDVAAEGPSAQLPDFGDGWDEIADGEAPEEFLCPITCALMRNPVRTADGHCYEKVAIEEWISSFDSRAEEPRSPLTNLPLTHTHLKHASDLAARISDWIAPRLSKRKEVGAGSGEVSVRCSAARSVVPAAASDVGEDGVMRPAASVGDLQLAEEVTQPRRLDDDPVTAAVVQGMPTDAEMQLLERLLASRAQAPRRHWASSEVPERERPAMAGALRRVASMEARERLRDRLQLDGEAVAPQPPASQRTAAGPARAAVRRPDHRTRSLNSRLSATRGSGDRPFFQPPRGGGGCR